MDIEVVSTPRLGALLQRIETSVKRQASAAIVEASFDVAGEEAQNTAPDESPWAAHAAEIA